MGEVMEEIKPKGLDYILICAYVLAAILFYQSLPFWKAAFLDFVFMLLLIGCLALLHGKEFAERRDSQYFKRGDGRDSRR